jgi:hypothetical protein
MIAAAVAIAAVTVAIMEFNSVYNATADITDAVSKAQLKAVQSTKQERLELDALWEAANDENLSKEKRLAAIDKLNKGYPAFHQNLKLETIHSQEAADAHMAAANAIIVKARAAAISEKITELYKKETDAVYDLTNGNIDLMSAFFAGGNMAAYFNLENKKIAGLKKQREAMEKLYKATAATNLELEKPTKTPAINTPTLSKGGTVVDNTPVAPLVKVENVAQGIKATTSAIVDQNLAVTDLAVDYEALNAKAREHALTLDDVVISAEQLNSAMNAAAAGGITNMAAALGNAIATGQDVGQAIGTAFLTSLADFLTKMGEMMITTATLWANFEAWIVSNPIAAVGIGVAAVAAGAALKATLAKGAQPKAFATGGMVNSPTFAMIGDNLNAHNNPEFVLRRDQLTKMLGNAGSFEPRLIPVIDARGISILVEEGNRQRRR